MVSPCTPLCQDQAGSPRANGCFPATSGMGSASTRRPRLGRVQPTQVQEAARREGTGSVGYSRCRLSTRAVSPASGSMLDTPRRWGAGRGQRPPHLPRCAFWSPVSSTQPGPSAWLAPLMPYWHGGHRR